MTAQPAPQTSQASATEFWGYLDSAIAADELERQLKQLNAEASGAAAALDRVIGTFETLDEELGTQSHGDRS